MTTDHAVYLDHAATTPVRAEVRAAMEPFAHELFGNPSSLHRWGREASAALEDARAVVADALGSRPSEIRFVRGGTESDNLAILGTCTALAAKGPPPALLVSAVEHPAVLEAARHAVAIGVAALDTIPVAPSASLDADVLSAGLEQGRSVVSIMWVNNETGLVLPVAGLTDLAKAEGAIVHSDASQAVGKVPVDVSRVPVDLLTATGHKIGGPKGMGILFVRDGTPLLPLLHGGGQERALRPGTEDVAAAVGFAEALRLAVEEQADEALRLERLRAELERRLTTQLGGIRVNGGGAPRAAHVSSLAFEGLTDGQALVMALDLQGVAASGGSACASGSAKGSHVIEALYGADDPHATVRFSFGKASVASDVDRAATATARVVSTLRGA